MMIYSRKRIAIVSLTICGGILFVFMTSREFTKNTTITSSDSASNRKIKASSGCLEALSNGTTCTQSGSSFRPVAGRPNIVFILADDLGWGDVGYHDSEIKTPAIDKLAYEGIRLENYYAQASCTPSRASIMTGRYMNRNGLERVMSLTEAGCLPTKYTLMPQLIKKYGYKTHLLGKWHLGFSRHECLPNQRGFDTFLGFRAGAQGYYSHKHEMPMMTKPNYLVQCYDFWENNNVTYKHQGEYSTHVYTKRAQNIIQQHSKSKVPMFLFLSFQAVHSRLEVPDSYMEQYNMINDTNRRVYAGMATCMDEGIHNITLALKEHGLWNNTVLIFSSDNGGTPMKGGNNGPLKGHKGQYLEGGIRVPGLVNSPLIPKEKRGTVFNGLMGISDWIPTMVEGIAGGRGANLPNLKLDGVNMWDALRFSDTSPRTEYLHAVGGNCDWDPDGPKDQRQFYGTLRWGEWKLRIGQISQRAFYLIPNSQTKYHRGRAIDIESILHQSDTKMLTNINEDPYEMKNLYRKHPGKHKDIFGKMLNRLKEHCRKSEEFVPVFERDTAKFPNFTGMIFPPLATWLNNDDEREWHVSERDRKRFLELYVEV